MKKIFAATLSAMWFLCSVLLAAEAQRPNVLLIMADDFGYECVTCNGGESYQTPRLVAHGDRHLRRYECTWTNGTLKTPADER